MSDPVDEPGWFDQNLYGHAVTYFDTNKWDFPVLSIAALGVVSLGIRRYREVYFAIACQLGYWYLGYTGPDAMYNALAGYQAGTGRYSYIYFPTMLTAYETIQKFNEKQAFTYKTTTTLGIYGLGFLLGKSRLL